MSLEDDTPGTADKVIALGSAAVVGGGTVTGGTLDIVIVLLGDMTPPLERIPGNGEIVRLFVPSGEIVR